MEAWKYILENYDVSYDVEQKVRRLFIGGDARQFRELIPLEFCIRNYAILSDAKEGQVALTKEKYDIITRLLLKELGDIISPLERILLGYD